MKKKHKLFIGIALVTMIGVFAGCIGLKPSDNLEFPDDFIGTWKKANLEDNITLTITKDTYKLSHHEGHFILVGVNEDIYYLAWHDEKTHTGSEVIVFTNGTLSISGCSGTELDNCNGVWVKQ